MSKEFAFQGKGLSIVQPWASAIAFAGKNIENRSWQSHYRGPLAIHASGKFFSEELLLPTRVVRGGERRPLEHWINRGQRKYGLDDVDGSIVTSHIVAITMLVDCVERSSSPWYGGAWGWVLEGVIPIEPIPWTGGLSTWNCKFKYRPLNRVV
ncbi:MAG TPA: hypothetical protein VHY91_05360 [Pirellulales bacterium]|jgi:hypothetical protein|nr:hypothetical protein [Pirellulales bacterium]